ncbi:MAG TPA: matrixin family metalloprotease [Pyrinomonadaceae bacterium]|nr:matrixin family metalloprotease [Pyrinomonadaceae bacterium]
MPRLITSLVLSALLLLTAVPARSYTYQYSSSSVQPRWTTNTITIALSTSLNSPPANIKAGSDVVGAARRALRRWSDVTNIQFVETSTAADSVSPQNVRDGINLITVSASATNDAFTNEGGVRRLGRTRVQFDSTGRMLEADLSINPRVPFSTDGTSNTYDLESTFVHELGHLLGLDHSAVIGATMQPVQGLNFFDPAFTFRTLSDDDIAGIRSIYGQRVAANVGSIAGQVNYGAGAHVWAENFYTGRVEGSSITKSDGTYRIDQLPTSDYRVFVEYLNEPVAANNILFSPPYAGISSQPAFRATETTTPVSVTTGNTTFLNPIITVGAPSINPRILGVNGALQATPVQLSAGRVFRFAVGGNNLASVPLTTSGFSVTSPSMTIDPASFAREDPANYGFTDPTFGIVSFNLVVADSAKFGDYTLRLRSNAGETAYLSGALALDPYTSYVESNPLENNGFFVRQQYLDFLFREPDTDGFNAWLGVLNRCAAAPSSECDRVTVSSAFFRSQEFQLKGSFIYRFYAVAFGRLPKYAEIIPDLQFVTGQTAEEVNARRDAYVTAFAQRPAFRSIYDHLSNADYVDTLLRTARVTISNRDQLVNNLNAGTQTRAQVLRAIVESPAVESKEFNPAFVAMQYFGYLKRDPEPEGFNAWLNYLNANSNDFRTMVNGFVNSKEYRSRFGQS